MPTRFHSRRHIIFSCRDDDFIATTSFSLQKQQNPLPVFISAAEKREKGKTFLPFSLLINITYSTSTGHVYTRLSFTFFFSPQILIFSTTLWSLLLSPIRISSSPGSTTNSMFSL